MLSADNFTLAHRKACNETRSGLLVFRPQDLQTSFILNEHV